MLSCFADAKVEYLTVGAYALAAHGYVRATSAIDLWIDNHPANCRRVLLALAAFGAPITTLSIEELQADDTVIQLGLAPSRIDILSGIDGVRFQDAYGRRLITRLDDVDVHVLGLADLLTNKLAANRDKDLSDIAWLRKHLS